MPDPFIIDDDILGRITIQPKGPKAPPSSLARASDPDDPLEDIIQRAIDKREWIEDSAVALIHVQECLTCGARHEYSHGWFTGKQHARDPSARQLVRGKPIGYFPLKVQRIMCSPVEVCGACAEMQIIIEDAACAPKR